MVKPRKWGNPEWSCADAPKEWLWRKAGEITSKFMKRRKFQSQLNRIMSPSPVFRKIMGMGE